MATIVTGVNGATLIAHRKIALHSNFPEAFFKNPKDCPFCPGNEHKTNDEFRRIADGGGRWAARAFLNIDPLIDLQNSTIDRAHRIIVPRSHALSLTGIPASEASAVLQLIWQERKASKSNPKIAYSAVFANILTDAAASQFHFHFQYSDMDAVPARVSQWAKKATGKCYYCSVGRSKQTLLIAENEHFIAYVPADSQTYYHVAIAAKDHQKSFNRFGDVEFHAFLHMLRLAVESIESVRQEPVSYNLLVRFPPYAVQNAHAVADIRPKYGIKRGGFELLTGIIPISKPLAEMAEQLREAAKNLSSEAKPGSQRDSGLPVP